MAKVKRGRFRGLPKNDVLVARAMANAQYGPKLSALQAMVQQAGENYLSDVGAAKGSAKAQIRAANKARKPTRQLYKAATSSTQDAAADVATAFGALGAAADPFRAATTREQGAALSRIAAARATALQGLKDRKMEARAGKALALRQARGQFRSEQAKLQQQGADVRYQRGQFLVGQLAGLQNDRAERRQKERASKRSAQTQLDVANTYANANKGKGKGGGGGSKPKPTLEARNDAVDAVAEALAWGRKLKGRAGTYKHGPMKGQPKAPNYQEAVELLTSGAGPIPRMEDTILVQAALQQVYSGKVNPATTRELRRRGLKPRRLGLTPYGKLDPGVAGPV